MAVHTGIRASMNRQPVSSQSRYDGRRQAYSLALSKDPFSCELAYVYDLQEANLEHHS